MFVALDSSNNRVYITSAVRGGGYFCPVCKKELIVKALESKAVRAHFAHKAASDCADDWRHDMSEWHFEWQNWFPLENREVVLEKDGIKHRADVLVGDTVIEFQHSPISNAEIMARNRFYTGCGYNLVWVFDATDKIKNVYGKSIDPITCGDKDLVWTRRNSLDLGDVPERVHIFLQYKKQTDGVEKDVLILVKSLHPLRFHKTVVYIDKLCFLKQFGCLDGVSDMGYTVVDKIPTVTEVIELTERTQKELTEQKKARAVFYVPPDKRTEEF